MANPNERIKAGLDAHERCWSEHAQAGRPGWYHGRPQFPQDYLRWRQEGADPACPAPGRRGRGRGEGGGQGQGRLEGQGRFD